MKSPAPRKNKALEQKRLGPAGWEQVWRRGSEDTSLTACPHSNVAPLSGTVQAMMQSEALERHLVQQSGTHEMLLSAVPSLGLHCATLTLTTGMTQSWGIRHSRRVYGTQVCSAIKKRKVKGKHDCYLQLSNRRVQRKWSCTAKKLRENIQKRSFTQAAKGSFCTLWVARDLNSLPRKAV